MNPFKVIDGTRDCQGRPLCESCRAAVSIKGQRFGDDEIYCRALSANGAAGSAMRIRFNVTACSAYDDIRQPSRYDLEQIAWELTTSPSRKIGFISPQERQARSGLIPPSSR